MSQAQALARLAGTWGIQLWWHDIWGNAHHVSEATQRKLLAAMRVPAENDGQVRQSLAQHEQALWSEVLRPALVVFESALPVRCTLRLPVEAEGEALAWKLIEEGGAQNGGAIDMGALAQLEQAEISGRRYAARELALPVRPAPGYHHLMILREAQTLAETVLVVAPDACYQPQATSSGGRVWGPSVQLYAVASDRNWGIGDFTDLRVILEQWGARGADVIGLNPLHALFPHNPEHASPYSPSSRSFLNPLYLDPERTEDFRESEEARARVAAASFQAALRELRSAAHVDYAAVSTLKLPVLELLYTSFRRRHLHVGSGRARRFREFQERGGAALRRHALFEALQEAFHRQDPSVWGWPAWPRSHRDPASPAVARFAESSLERVEFYEWLQWQADVQLAAAGARAAELRLGLGLYGDLAVSVDRGGAETWANQELYALDASVGAPPDDFNLKGQNWGLPPMVPRRLERSGFAPFIQTLRANMQHTGALRIDHVMGLTRLFWIPAGADAAEGAYVHYPLHELLGIVALESHRNRCLVVGEDLGTVPDGVRHALHERQVLSYRLLYFERNHGGDFKAPEELPAQALVAASTHDLPTLAGFWEGHDLELRTRLDLFPSEEVRHRQIRQRAEDRRRLLLTLEREALLPAGVTADPTSVPSLTPELERAIHVHLARTPCQLLMIQPEDVVGMTEQVNLPGTSDGNWRRKIVLSLERWPQDERFVRLCAEIAKERPRRDSAPGGSRRSGSRIPRATYRLQLNRTFTLSDATALVPYLAELGVSHAYCSPYLRARPGSMHGYDIIDHNALNPEIGTPEDLERFVAALHSHGMGQILDVVPNHMGIMGADNTWWLDVLENGRASAYADFFDIDWDPANPALRDKALLPVLGDHYGVVLERGELQLAFERDIGSFRIGYCDHRFPVDPREYSRILQRVQFPDGLEDLARAEFESLITAFSHLPSRDGADGNGAQERNRDKELHKRRLARLCDEHQALDTAVQAAVSGFNGTLGDPSSFDLLHELLENQAYRLAYWRVASDEINYRRFFDINDLAALRMENMAVFEATHRLVLRLVAERQVDGLRIDHPDGLYLPADYFGRIQQRVAMLRGEQPSDLASAVKEKQQLPVYLVIEKITAGHERVPESWPVHGTTGYRFANVVNGLFVDGDARGKIDRAYRAFVPDAVDYDEETYRSKHLVVRTALASELTVLANQLARVARDDRRTRDFTFNTLRRALAEVIACFPVYRTYVDQQVHAQDRRFIEWAVARAKRRSRAADASIFDFVREVLLCRAGETADAKEAVCVFARKFQQVTAPVTAKGVEDTAFYRYNRLVSLNEVGGNPAQFGFTVAAFHGASQDRAARWPYTMLATSTHDTKRSEDVRVRIDVLSEMPAAWRLRLRHWSRINRSRKRRIDERPAPSANDEYLLYQTLLGSWPSEPLDDTALGAYRERIQAYMLKALREAKLHSSWINPNADYERAVTDFVQSLLGRLDGNRFLEDFVPVQRHIAWLGMLNGLSQTAIKLASPGVPDIFQGCELWDFSLVDPDNRRPVDYALRRALLAEVRALQQQPPDERGPRLRSLLQEPLDGRSKLYVTYCGLRLRREREALFRRGDYTPLSTEGERASHLVAFARRLEHIGAILVAPRLLAPLVPHPGYLPVGKEAWGDTAVVLPWTQPGMRIHNVYGGGVISLHQDQRGPHLVARELFADFPVALLEYEMP